MSHCMFVHYSDCTLVHSTTLPLGIRMSSDNLSCNSMTRDTICNTRVGATGRSVVRGTKLSSLYCQSQSVLHKLFPLHCCLFSRVVHTRCCHIGAHAVALSVTMVRSSGEQRLIKYLAAEDFDGTTYGCPYLKSIEK